MKLGIAIECRKQMFLKPKHNSSDGRIGVLRSKDPGFNPAWIQSDFPSKYRARPKGNSMAVPSLEAHCRSHCPSTRSNSIGRLTIKKACKIKCRAGACECEGDNLFRKIRTDFMSHFRLGSYNYMDIISNIKTKLRTNFV